MDKKGLIKVIVSVLIIVAAVLFIAGILTGKDLMYHLQNRSAIGPLTRDDIVYERVEAPEPSGKDKTIQASDWKEAFPEIVTTMGDNAKNTYVTDYLEQDPYLVNLYEGYGFAKDYGSARGHEYTLEDVAKTKRPHALANCLTCKTPNFTKLVNDLGVSVYTMSFEEVMAQMEENVSCYTCHANQAGNEGELVVTHSYVLKALGDSVSEIDAATLSCGQCHIEYYFTPSDKETMMPYQDIASMAPEKILAYYDSMEMPDGSIGFYDWIQESTGAKMLKAQHPEMETFLYGKHAKEGMNCADCHMPIEMNEQGSVYHSHELVSPLENTTLLSTCVQCHNDTDMVSLVRKLQARVIDRETEIGNRLSDFKNALASAVASKALSEDKLDEIRKLYREAQWFFDFCYVENSEGAHNSDLAFNCLDLSAQRITEGLKLLGIEE